MKRLILLRHGQTQQDKGDPERRLTMEGEEQIAASTFEFKDHVSGTCEIMYSPTLRTRQSAMIVADILDCEVLAERPLRIVNADSIRGRVKANESLGIPAAATYLNRLHEGPVELETPQQLYERFLKIFEASEAETVIAISHEASLDAFFKSIKGFSILTRSFEQWFGYADYAVLERSS